MVRYPDQEIQGCLQEARTWKVSHHRVCEDPPTPNLVGRDLSDSRSRKWRGLLVKEALHILHIPKNQCYNHDVGQELPNCWALNHQGYASTYS